MGFWFGFVKSTQPQTRKQSGSKHAAVNTVIFSQYRELATSLQLNYKSTKGILCLYLYLPYPHSAGSVLECTNARADVDECAPDSERAKQHPDWLRPSARKQIDKHERSVNRSIETVPGNAFAKQTAVAITRVYIHLLAPYVGRRIVRVLSSPTRLIVARCMLLRSHPFRHDVSGNVNATGLAWPACDDAPRDVVTVGSPAPTQVLGERLGNQNSWSNVNVAALGSLQ